MKHFTFYHGSNRQAAIEGRLYDIGAPRTRVIGGPFFFGRAVDFAVYEDSYVPVLDRLPSVVPTRVSPGDFAIVDHEPPGFMAALDDTASPLTGEREAGLLCAAAGAVAAFGCKPIVYGPWIDRGMNDPAEILRRWLPVAHVVRDYGGGLMQPVYCPPGHYELSRNTTRRWLGDVMRVADLMPCDVYHGLWRLRKGNKSDIPAPSLWDEDVFEAMLARRRFAGLIFFGIGLDRSNDDVSVSVPWAERWIERVQRQFG